MFFWGHNRRFNSYREYFLREFGGRVQKLSIDAGFSCPNRDGTKGTGGCTFCDNDAFNPSYCHPSKSITQQIAEGIEFHEKRYRRADRYLAYFQAFSNTYAPLERLKALYSEALAIPHVIGLVIGTRPDCIDREKLDYFRSLSKEHYLILEYGIESCYDKTLKRVNRGHSFRDAANALRLTREYGIKTGAHMIFGLPGESRDEMLAEAGILSELPLDTIKFHQLQVFKDTAIAEEFTRHPEEFISFSLEDYVDFIIDFMELLSPHIVIERFAGEVPPRFLVGEGWGKIRYDEIARRVEQRLEERNTWQGRNYKEGSFKTPD